MEKEIEKNNFIKSLKAKRELKRIFKKIDELINEKAKLAMAGDASSKEMLMEQYKDEFCLVKQDIINKAVRPAAQKVQKNNTSALCVTLVGQAVLTALTGAAYYFLGQKTGVMFPVIGGLSLGTALGLIGHQLFCYQKAKRVEKEANFANARYLSTQCARCRDREMDVLAAALSDVADFKVEEPVYVFEELQPLEEEKTTKMIDQEANYIAKYVSAYFDLK